MPHAPPSWCCLPPPPISCADNVSWVVNIALFAAKFYAFWISGSKAVLASLADSFVDLVREIYGPLLTSLLSAEQCFSPATPTLLLPLIPHLIHTSREL